MKRLIVLFFCSFLLACTEEIRFSEDRIQAYNTILAVDGRFATSTQTHGFKEACMEYMDMNAIFVSRDAKVKKSAEVLDFFSALTGDFQLSWQVLGADVYSETAGYTYGNYILEVDEERYEGSYVTVWKKANDGKWKFTLSSLPDIIMALSN